MKNVIYEVVKSKNTIERMLESLAIFNRDFITHDDKIDVIIYGMAELYNYTRQEINVDYVTQIFTENDFMDDDFLDKYDEFVKAESKTIEDVLHQIVYEFMPSNMASELVDYHYKQISHLVKWEDKRTIETKIFQELLFLIYGINFEDKFDAELYSIAYDRGHAYGYRDIESNLISMLKLHEIHHNT